MYVENCNDVSFNDSLRLNMIVYPNPSNGVINMNISGVQNDLKLVLFDINGRVVHTESVNSSNQSMNRQLDLSSFPKGIYLVHLSDSEQSLVSKILLV